MKTSEFSASEYLETAEDVKAYLQAALDENDAEFFIDALGVVSRSKGMKELSQKTGLGYQSLYKSFGAGKHPRFETVYKVVNALGLNFRLV
ncbi:addiction module antidote protein [Thiomicrorhabdus sp. Milos-T2]|uniref:addiction module antidote protein n=1 Tax=Thiomicrorhabdus sp. Milos-T2 TaxID=90814 RepID=UPI000494D62F|nr:addiction module antidote protein [Thiomicrorhabdus sp. Milos-T2]